MSVEDKYITLTTEKIPSVFEAGKQSEYDKFWDEFQQNGNRTFYWGAFVGPGWNDELFKPKYPFNNVVEMGYMFRDNKITTVPRMCINNSNVSQVFYNAKYVKTIEGLVFLKTPNKFTGTFDNALALENLVIEGIISANGFNVQWSTKLTHDSLMSIINALADKSTDTSGTIWKVTLGSENIAKLTSEECNIASRKGWYLE